MAEVLPGWEDWNQLQDLSVATVGLVLIAEYNILFPGFGRQVLHLTGIVHINT